VVRGQVAADSSGREPGEEPGLDLLSDDRATTVGRRGQVLMRREILDAAIVLLGQAGTDDGVTLRAIARQAGIAAPSVYPHFSDRDAIIDAVLAEGLSYNASTAARARTGR
jgi:AcrR family transcriptional regulator